MFSQNLQKIRSEKNLSQEQLADKIGVSRQTISAWESGKASPELDKITAISKLFSVSIDELVGEIGDKDEKNYVIIKNIDTISFKTVFKSLENYGEKINFKNSDELESLLDCVREKNFKFSFKEYIEKN